MVSYHLMGIALRLGVMETSGNRGYLMPLIVRFEVVKMKSSCCVYFTTTGGKKETKKSYPAIFQIHKI